MDLNEAFEAGCESALSDAYDQMVDTWGEKTANVVMDKLKGGYRAAKGAVARTGHQLREGATGRRSVADEYANLQRPGSRNMTGKEQAVSGAKGLGKTLAAGGIAGGGGYAGYMAMQDDKKKKKR